MTLHHDLKQLATRTVVRASMPVDDLRHMIATKGAIQPDAHINKKALSGVLPFFRIDWDIPGAATVANNQGGIRRMPQPSLLRRIDVILKTAPSGGPFTIRLTNNGGEIPDSRVTVQAGQLAGASGLSQTVSGGDALRVDILAVNGAADVTVSVFYLPVLE